MNSNTEIYSTEGMKNKALGAIRDFPQEVFFLGDIQAKIGVSRPTFDKYLPTGSADRQEVLDALQDNKTRGKMGVLKAVYEAATKKMDMTAAKMFLKWVGSDEERSRLSDRPSVVDDAAKNDLVATQQRIADAMERGNQLSQTFKLIPKGTKGKKKSIV